MTVQHCLSKLLELDDSLEPSPDDPADEALAVPDDLIETLDFLQPSMADGLQETLDATNYYSSSTPQIRRRRRKQVNKERRRRVWATKLPVLEGSLQIVESCSPFDRSSLKIVKTRRWRTRERTCNRCSATNTPQWRGGPDGPGTLCNACGIRYKSSRLLPEYLPRMMNPGFEQDKHLNSHKYIMKSRKRSIGPAQW